MCVWQGTWERWHYFGISLSPGGGCSWLQSLTAGSPASGGLELHSFVSCMTDLQSGTVMYGEVLRLFGEEKMKTIPTVYWVGRPNLHPHLHIINI